MKGPLFLSGEKDFISKYYDYFEIQELTDRLNNIFHNRRSISSIAVLKSKFKKDRGIRKDAAKVVLERQKVAALTPALYSDVGLSLKFKSNFHPAIKSKQLIKIMDETNTSLWDIAKAIRLDIDDVRLMTRNGGLPKIYAWPVIKMYRQLGVTL